MERELIHNLKGLAEAFVAARPVSMATVGRLAAGDWRFFDRLDDGDKSFTIRKYDDIVAWFSENWPQGAIWPENVARPAQVPA